MKQQPLRYHFKIQKNWRWKIYFSVIQFILIFFWSSAGYSDNFIVTGAGTEYQATSKWSGIFTASNKTVYDTSHLYEAENTQFFFKAYYKTFLYNDRILFRIPFTYDNGYESALFSADPSLSFWCGFELPTKQRITSFNLYSRFCQNWRLYIRETVQR